MDLHTNMYFPNQNSNNVRNKKARLGQIALFMQVNQGVSHSIKSKNSISVEWLYLLWVSPATTFIKTICVEILLCQYLDEIFYSTDNERGIRICAVSFLTSQYIITPTHLVRFLATNIWKTWLHQKMNVFLDWKF